MNEVFLSLFHLLYKLLKTQIERKLYKEEGLICLFCSFEKAGHTASIKLIAITLLDYSIKRTIGSEDNWPFVVTING